MVLPPYKKPIHAMPSGVASTNRDAAGSVAPMSTVGGSRQMAQMTARMTMANGPWPAIAEYTPLTSGTTARTKSPHAPMPSSSNAYSRSGFMARVVVRRGRSRLPRHIPPMYVARSTPSEIADDPITSSSS